MKLVERFDKNTYRCVYAAKLDTGVYVLHAYMKKSKEGKSTPQQIIETVEGRYKAAVRMDKEEKAKVAALAQQQAAEASTEKLSKRKAKR